MRHISIQARISLTEAQAIASAGRLPTGEDAVATLAETLADAGSQFLHEVIQRNTPSDAVLVKRFRRAMGGLDQAIEALMLPPIPAGPAGEKPAHVVLTDERQRIRETLNRMALMTRHRSEPDDVDPKQRIPQALERVNILLEGVADLRSLLRLTVRQLEHEAATRPKDDGPRAPTPPVSQPPAIPGRQLVRQTSLARVVWGPPAPLHSGRRADVAFDRFLWRLWHLHVCLAKRLPATTVQWDTGDATGPFLQYCRAALDWLRIQVPDDLYERDPKLQKCFRSSLRALRARLQRVIDFRNMRRK